MEAEILLIVSVTLIAITYVGYPALVYVLSRLFPRPVQQAAITPRVSLIIAAHNEERDIAVKLRNALSLDYPTDRLEIIVASDCSTDHTDDIVRSFTRQGVILYRQTERFGKTIAQNQAVRLSTGEILVFSDATTMYEPDALRRIVRSFADPEVGCVAGQLMYVDRTTTAVGSGCRSYWGYEKMLKSCESRLGSLIGVSGCLYAVRRSCHTRLSSDLIDDFVIASEIQLQGLRTIYEPAAIATEDTNKRSRDEFCMRVRVIEQTICVLYRYRRILNPLRHGLFAFQMLSHKVLRYAVPCWLVTAFAANWWLLNKADFFRFTFACQMALVVIALIGWCRITSSSSIWRRCSRC
jgi:cellulose synthase/poly-beta-1,6-N-acetylglucosamine synthase-like glycosyltransferase